MNQPTPASAQPQLARTLGPLMLWGLGVGYVISGMYFGWNIGLARGGTYGMAIATGVSILLYLCFTFSYTELACAIPRAGGVFDYATRALGPAPGFIAGVAQIIEFVFAPPAIAVAIGTYFHIFLPQFSISSIAIAAYVVFTALNVYGVKAAATFELLVTILAVFELLLFSGITLPHFKLANLQQNAFPHGWTGAWAAIPFAIWFFLGLEGVANVAEEAINPQRNVLLGFGSALLTLIILCILVFISSVGIGGWEAIVYPSPGAAESDKPLPLALAAITGNSGWMYHLLVTIGLMGLVASFHGIILASGRASYEFSKAGFMFRSIGHIHPKFKTPANALLLNMVLGIAALLTGKTDEIITISVFGALTIYFIAMISIIVLRKKEAGLERPFKVPAYPLLPLTALVISGVFLVAMVTLNLLLAFIYFLILALSYIAYRFFIKKREHVTT